MPWRLFFFLLVLIFPKFLHAESVLVLTAERVKELALQKNIAIQIAKLEKKIGDQDLPAAQSVYDTTLTSSVSHTQDKSARTTNIFGTETNSTALDISLQQKAPSGTEFSLGFFNLRDSTDSAFATINPAFDSKLEISLKQPVAQNALGFVDRKQIQMVKKELEALDGQTRFVIQTRVYEILKHYWDFYYAHHLLKHDREAVEKARDLLAAARQKEKLGLIEAIDLNAYEANLALKEAASLQAENYLLTAVEALRRDLDATPEIVFAPGDEVFSHKTLPPLDETIAEAIAKRPDYQALKMELEASHIKVSLEKNKRWPQINLLASFALNGVDQSYESAIQDIGDGHPAWLTGMELSFPLQNRFQRSELRKGELARAKKILQLRDKELEIVEQVAKTIRQTENAFSRLLAALKIRGHQYQKVVGELKKYEHGRSDSDTVIRLQNDYIDAQRLALKSQVDYQLSNLDLIYVNGRVVE